MNAEHSKLYGKIQAFPMNDPGALFPFAARLANENGWSRAYAERVIEEYKKFVFLKKAAGHPVCPSDHVDQAWHLHLTFTQSYWSEFCPDVLEGPLHHTPSQGGDERGKYGVSYTRTLASYRALLDAEPPADIWPAPQARFLERTACRRIETGRYFLVPRALAIGVLIVSGLGLAVYHAKWFVDGLEAFSKWCGASPFAVTFLGVLAAMAGGHLFHRILRKPFREAVDVDFDLDLYEVATLANGAEGAVHAALLRLAGRGMLGVDAKNGTFTRTAPLVQPYLPLEQSIHEALASGKAVTEGVLRGAALPVLDDIAGKLRTRGLLVTVSSRTLGQFVPTFAILAAGLLRLVSIEARQLEDWAPFYLCTFGWALLVMFCSAPRHRTLLGDRVLERLCGDSRCLHARAEADLGGMTPLLATTIAVALFGLGVLPEKDPSREALEGGTDYTSGCG
jgi:uncharacterized protein (TIGR04222 family)